MTEYIVRFSELKEDTERFEFVLGDSFFQVFQSSEWESGDVTSIVDVRKRADGFTMDFKLKGRLNVVCDRCLESFPLKVDFSERLFVKYGQEEEELDYNIVVIAREDNKIDLGQILYEYLLLSLPVKKVHSEHSEDNSDCNQEMIEKLKKHIITEESGKTDPRWDDLKKIFDKN